MPTTPPTPKANLADLATWDGALLLNKEVGVSSFGVLEALQRSLIAETGLKKRDLPKLGHGGTLDPFATGLLPVCVGRAVKLTRYFLGSQKTYTGTIRFGETTVPGDPTSPVSERSDHLPSTLAEIQRVATQLTKQIYLQTPPMHSAKKVDGKALYTLAREGIEIDREPKPCQLYEFEILSYQAPLAEFRVTVSSGTYIRVLAQDLGRLLGTVAMLDRLDRTATGGLKIETALKLKDIKSPWPELGAWVPFDRLLEGYPQVEATLDEARALIQGKQGVLFPLVKRASPSQLATAGEDCVAIYHRAKLIGVTRLEVSAESGSMPQWAIERVFTSEV